MPLSRKNIRPNEQTKPTNTSRPKPEWLDQSNRIKNQGLSFPSDFLETRQICKAQKKWLMVNIQASIIARRRFALVNVYKYYIR